MIWTKFAYSQSLLNVKGDRVPCSLELRSLGTERVLKLFFFILKHNKTFISPPAVFSEKVTMDSRERNPKLTPLLNVKCKFLSVDSSSLLITRMEKSTNNWMNLNPFRI